MNTNTHSEESVQRTSPPRAVVTTVGELVQDVVTLMELQAALFKEELDAGLIRLARLVGIVVFTSAIAFSCLPIALMSVAFWFHAYEWSLAGSFAWATAIGLLVALGSGVAGWLVFQRSQPVFARSKRELRQNMNWLKQALSRNQPTSSNQ